MTSPDDRFAEQLRAARDGDRKALDGLLTQLEHRFRVDAERRVGTALRGRTRVSDILQDAYVEVVRSLAGFDGSTEGEFFTWVTKIIENAARRQHRHLTAQKRKPPSGTTEWNALTAAVMRRVTSPLSDLQRAEDAELIVMAIRDLREDHQVAIEQLVLLERPIGEVAEALGRSEAATRMLLSRARAALTARIDQLYRERSGL
ncbi:MAG: sigma-70 family RNA polymerase sigma factor [Planctomycetes bacterium]|nr:sigma-70 family RNA polymerase sigma factor [Planctomycetota bacterium]